MSQLPVAIENLSPTEKYDLLDALWESLETDATPLSDEQREALDSRCLEYERNPSRVIGWEQIKAGLLKKD